jgi:hypothetical protein
MKIVRRSIMLFFLALSVPVFSISATQQSSDDYRFTLELMRHIEIMVLNFPTESIKNQYDAAQKSFSKASKEFYSRDFVSSAQLFKKLKMDLIKLTENIADNYLKRTKEIMDSTSHASFDILIKYSKHSGKLAYFQKPFDPLYDIKHYNEKNYHLYYDRERIESLLKNGFAKYNMAKKFFSDPELEYIKNHKRITHRNINYIIDRYISIINLCREAKQCGIEIHKIGITVEKEIDISKVKRLSPHQLVKTPGLANIDPIFDGRIPEKYKVDANDNINLIHEHEVKRRGTTPQKYRNIK